MKFRKILSVIGITVLIFSVALPIYADEGTAGLPPDMNKDKIKSEIAAFINASFFSENLTTRAKPENVNLSTAIKIYVDTNIFELPIKNYDELVLLLEREGNYIFEISAHVGKYYFIANIQRAKPLTNKTKELISTSQAKAYNDRVNEWMVSAVSEFESKDDYQSYIKRMAVGDISKLNNSSILIGGLPYFHDAVSVSPNSKGEINEIVPTFPETTKWDDLGISDVSTIALNYKSIKKTMNTLPKEEKNISAINEDTMRATGSSSDELVNFDFPSDNSNLVQTKEEGNHLGNYFPIFIIITLAITAIVIITYHKMNNQDLDHS
jgi:hypothetical protein